MTLSANAQSKLKNKTPNSNHSDLRKYIMVEKMDVVPSVRTGKLP